MRISTRYKTELSFFVSLFFPCLLLTRWHSFDLIECRKEMHTCSLFDERYGERERELYVSDVRYSTNFISFFSTVLFNWFDPNVIDDWTRTKITFRFISLGNIGKQSFDWASRPTNSIIRTYYRCWLYAWSFISSEIRTRLSYRDCFDYLPWSSNKFAFLFI